MVIVATAAFELRPAVAADTDAIVDVWFNGWREAHLGHVPEALLVSRTESTFRDRIPAIIDNTTVGTVDDRVAGLVVTADDEIEQLYVGPGHRGTGLAAVLLKHGETAIAQHHRRAFLAVVDGNTRARRFYERGGWSDVGPFDYRAWVSNGKPVVVPCRRYEKALGRTSPPTPSGSERFE